MKKRILVTGAEGFLGSHLCEELISGGHEVIRLTRTEVANVDFVVDLADESQLSKAVSESNPEVVVHLAAISYVPHGDRAEIYNTNLIGSLNLMNAIKLAGTKVKKVVALSSAAIYGRQDSPILSEEMTPSPNTDYGVSKLAMEHMLLQSGDELAVVLVRLFNCTGVGQSEKFVIPKIVQHYAGGAAEIELGNLDSVREYNDVRFVVRCLASLILNVDRSIATNLSTGVGHSLRSVMSVLSDLTGRTVNVRQNEKLLRANEVREILGSTDRLHSLISSPEQISLKDTLSWMLSSYRSR